MRRCIIVLCALVPSFVCGQQPQVPQSVLPGVVPAPGTATEDVHAAAKRLLESPNDANRHLALAKAYYVRGAVNDVRRCTRHADRALTLNPLLRTDYQRFLSETHPGVTYRSFDDEEAQLDEDLRKTIPSDEDTSRLADERITNGLAHRLARGVFATPGPDVLENIERYRELFDWKTGKAEDQRSWNDRLSQLSALGEAYNGRTSTRFLAETIMPQLLRHIDSGAFATHIIDPEDWKVSGVDIFKTKGEALTAFLQGNAELAVDKLIETAAAAETRIAQLAAKDETDDEAEGVDPLESSIDAPPGTFDMLRPQHKKLADEATAALEAMANPDVPTDSVGTKLVELANEGNCGSPLLIDVDGDGRPGVLATLVPDGIFDRTTAVTFDLDGNGAPELVEWLQGDADGLLFVDLDGDGLVGSGAELFGTAHGDRDGFARLRRFDLDGDGWVDGTEAADLRVWLDDGDGRCRPDEVRTLAELGIVGLSWRAAEWTAPVRFADGSTGRCWDWWPELRW